MRIYHTCSRSSKLSKQLKRITLAVLIAGQAGCGLVHRIPPGPHDTRTSYHDNFAMRIEYPEVAECQSEVTTSAQSAIEPLALQDPSQLPTFDMTLDEAIRMAVQQSPVLRSVGGSIVTSPVGARTIYDPALSHANPQGGVEAALSAFDAQYSQNLFWQKLDSPNNASVDGIFGNFNRLAFQATQSTYTNQLSKYTAQGGQFALRNVINYDRNNRLGRTLKSEFNGFVEAEWRQPLMQGAGTHFNRIAGPNAQVGQYNGVLIARVREDVALADFESAMINLVSDVEEAYWRLSIGYRILEANLKGRESALQTLQYQQVRLEVGTGRRDEEAQAQSQYYQFQGQVESALAGTQGLYTLEQNLRYLIGLTATDGRLIRPTTDPADTKVVYDWESALSQALSRRVEVRRQRFNIKQRELEMYASRMNRRPKLDFLGQYRYRGLGDHLIGSEGGSGNLSDNVIGSITQGDYQEWYAGMELNFPVGLRAASAAVAHARLNLNRERAVLAETELRISHDLSSASRRITLTHQLLETNYNRYVADLNQVDVLRRRYRDGTDNINFLLQAQRQVVVSEAAFYQSLADYQLAIRDFHREKGSLLAYNQVQLAEGPWAGKAYQDAYEVGRFLTPRAAGAEVSTPAPITRTPFDPAAVQSTSSVGVPLDSSTPLPSGEFLESDGTGGLSTESELMEAPL
jgi:outer membrane protein TolC